MRFSVLLASTVMALSSTSALAAKKTVDAECPTNLAGEYNNSFIKDLQTPFGRIFQFFDSSEDSTVGLQMIVGQIAEYQGLKGLVSCQDGRLVFRAKASAIYRSGETKTTAAQKTVENFLQGMKSNESFESMTKDDAGVKTLMATVSADVYLYATEKSLFIATRKKATARINGRKKEHTVTDVVVQEVERTAAK